MDNPIIDKQSNKNTNQVQPENFENARTHRPVFSDLLDRLSANYGVNMHELVKL